MANPAAAPSSAPLAAEKSPIKAAMPPTTKPITANAQFNALLPLAIVIVLRSRIAPDRGGFSTAGRRTGRRVPRGWPLVRKARGDVALNVLAGNVTQRTVADFRGGRGIAACAVRCRRAAFCTVMLFTGECDGCFRLNRAPPDRTRICRKATRGRGALAQKLMRCVPRCCAQVRRGMPVVAGCARIAPPQSGAAARRGPPGGAGGCVVFAQAFVVIRRQVGVFSGNYVGTL